MYSYKEIDKQMQEGQVRRLDMLGMIVDHPVMDKPAYLIFGRLSCLKKNGAGNLVLNLRNAVVYNNAKNETDSFYNLTLIENSWGELLPLSDDFKITNKLSEFKSELENKVDVLPTNFVLKLLGEEWKWDGKCFSCKKKVNINWEKCPYCKEEI